MSDDIWEESVVKGFHFDLEESDNISTYSQSLAECFTEAFSDEPVVTDLNSQFCAICHNLITNQIYYEKDAIFCSEACWLKAITIALDDFVVEGMSTWPLSTFVSQASKVVLLNLATRSFDGNLIIKKNWTVSRFKKIYEEKEWNLTYNELSLDANVRKATMTLPNTLIMQPLCETLSALVRMDQTVKTNSRAEILGKKCKMSDEQFKWLVIEPLVQSQNWNDLECILLKKKSLSRRMEVILPSDRLVLHLYSLGAPNNIIENYLKFISDNEEFIQIAIRLKMIDEALKLCLERRNVNALKDLLSQIPSNHRRKEEISHYLSIPVAQWKDFLCK
ncbi:unnamed protein product [Trichobilharzia szidati]|nr:unnamed protein product [Trichobilharzia szidati]